MVWYYSTQPKCESILLIDQPVLHQPVTGIADIPARTSSAASISANPKTWRYSGRGFHHLGNGVLKPPPFLGHVPGLGISGAYQQVVDRRAKDAEYAANIDIGLLIVGPNLFHQVHSALRPGPCQGDGEIVLCRHFPGHNFQCQRSCLQCRYVPLEQLLQLLL